MSTIPFNISVFRTRFPAFASDAVYPDAMLEGWWDIATCYISDKNYGIFKGKCRELAIMLMVAHIAAINDLIQQGITPGQISSASIDKVSVSINPPPVDSQFSWWLSLTPYGQQLDSLLSTASVGGWHVGGLPERSAFRKAGGVF